MDLQLTARAVQSLLDYDPDTGWFRWIKPRGRAGRGSSVGCPSTRGYLRIGIAGKLYYAHRLAWLYVHGTWPEHEIDHINGDVTDNRIANLRPVRHQANSQNVRHAARHSTTGLLGAHRKGSRFASRITVDGVHHYLGTFNTAQQAHEAYVEAKRELHFGNTL